MAPELTIGAAQTQARRRLEGISETPTLDVQLLLADLVQQTRAWVMAHPEFCLDRPGEDAFANALARLAGGEPLAYVLAWWEFFGRRFRVTPAVLIPRPETELLVETALRTIRSESRTRTAVEIGTGSGCIGITLAIEAPGLSMIATDISDQALAVCQENVRRYGVEDQVRLVRSDLVAPLSGSVDLVVANLPYIPTETLAKLAVGKHEPIVALDGGPDGLLLMRRLFGQLSGIVGPNSVILLEIGSEQGVPATAEAKASFPSASVQVVRDLAGLDRVLVIRLDPDD